MKRKKYSLNRSNFDNYIKKLSKIQADLFDSKISANDYNNVSEMIGNLKEYLANCKNK